MCQCYLSLLAGLSVSLYGLTTCFCYSVISLFSCLSRFTLNTAQDVGVTTFLNRSSFRLPCSRFHVWKTFWQYSCEKKLLDPLLSFPLEISKWPCYTCSLCLFLWVNSHRCFACRPSAPWWAQCFLKGFQKCLAVSLNKVPCNISLRWSVSCFFKRCSESLKLLWWETVDWLEGV